MLFAEDTPRCNLSNVYFSPYWLGYLVKSLFANKLASVSFKANTETCRHVNIGKLVDSIANEFTTAFGDFLV